MSDEIKIYRIIHNNYTNKELYAEKYWVPENNGGEGGYVHPVDFKQEYLLVAAQSEYVAIHKAKVFLKDKFLGNVVAVGLLESYDDCSQITDVHEYVIVW